MTNKIYRCLLLCLLLLCSEAAFALRCGHVLVNLGDSKRNVIEKCGEPESIDTHIERRGAENRVGVRHNYGRNPRTGINYGQKQYFEIEVVVEEWIYDFGRRRLQQYLRFENGRLKEVKSIGRGN